MHTTSLKELALEADKLDSEDSLAEYRKRFNLPHREDNSPLLYLCGNSLGPQATKAKEYVREELDDWASMGVEGHTEGNKPWLPYHEFLTENMAMIAGAKESEVVTMNSLTLNIHLLLVSFYRPTSEKYKIIIEENAFPSDIYAVKSQIRYHGYDPDDALLIVPCSEGKSYTTQKDFLDFIHEQGEKVATILIGGVNYYSGQVMPMEEIVEAGHQHDCLVGYDMAHGAGNIPMNLHDIQADFAAWCSYKYLNGGPGALSGVFIHEKHHNRSDIPRFEGWWGHDKKSRFKMPDEFRAIPTAEAWQLSNPPILPLACMRASLEIFAEAGLKNIRKKSIRMMDYAERCLETIPKDKIEFITPADPDMRGCQLSIRIKDRDKSVYANIEKQGVVADWREPDVIRIAFAPLYNTYREVFKFSQILKEATT